tara:strand:- start:817 stop:1269 length:453 start_codon:yes stop_codon:yes gene_type:complete
MRLDIRQIHALKNKNNLTGVGVPNSGEGSDGEIRLQKTNNGVKLYAKYSGEWFAFSPDESPAKSTAGNIELPGGFIMKYGKETVTSSSTPVTFAQPFQNECKAIFLTIEDAGIGGEPEAIGVRTTYVSTTGFTVNTESTHDGFYWMAIGN